MRRSQFSIAPPPSSEGVSPHPPTQPRVKEESVLTHPPTLEGRSQSSRTHPPSSEGASPHSLTHPPTLVLRQRTSAGSRSSAVRLEQQPSTVPVTTPGVGSRVVAGLSGTAVGGVRRRELGIALHTLGDDVVMMW